MTKQVISVGSAANDGSGTPARTAFQYVNANFTELYDSLSGTTNATALPTPPRLASNNIWTGTQVFNARATFIGSTSILQLRPSGPSQACYILGQDETATNHWYIGKGSSSTANVAWHNYAGNNNINLNADGTIVISGTPLLSTVPKVGGVDLMRVGSFGIGARSLDGALGTTDLDTLPAGVGFEARLQNQSANATSALHYPLGGAWGTLLRYDSDTHGFQNYICASTNRIFYRRKGSGTIFDWFELRTTANTTVDGNGFIKAASPVGKLFADSIELNEDAQKQPITFEKLGVGDYLIKGSLGFAEEGWYIEMPKDANGNVVVAVAYQQLENNDISIKTYKKKFEVETASIVPDLDNPVDIPEGRNIDIRFHEEPVIEETLPDDSEQ
ncbi:pyocin knob domain-containing protein [Acinetobacter baumannii]|uniref:pyocin knob domain-containing protein n=1 Tax=Acinetobacter baumannii TaxID=470 RepID=UPI0011289FC3|nr:pyocin knob domain-containing protein [Acinetobacter baumannii]EHU2649451.1 phage tail protein [Acinetobacter baumannii]TPU95060.1 phage tail protein [Acinetobacter baumannii]